MIPLKARLSPSDRIAIEESMALKSLGARHSTHLASFITGALLGLGFVVLVVLTMRWFG